jgi:hypothetical protein
VLKISKCWLLLLIPVLAVAGFIFMIWYGSYDHRGKILEAILFDKNSTDEQVFTAALAVRFPAGSNLKDFQDVIQNLEGKCEKLSNSDLLCKVPKAATMCVSSWLEFKVNILSDGKIKNVTVKDGFLAC